MLATTYAKSLKHFKSLSLANCTQLQERIGSLHAILSHAGHNPHSDFRYGKTHNYLSLIACLQRRAGSSIKPIIVLT